MSLSNLATLVILASLIYVARVLQDRHEDSLEEFEKLWGFVKDVERRLTNLEAKHHGERVHASALHGEDWDAVWHEETREKLAEMRGRMEAAAQSGPDSAK